MPMTKSSGYRPGIPTQPYTKWDADKDEVEVDYKQMAGGKGQNCFSGRKGIALKVLIALVIFFWGLILGYIIRRSVHETFVMPKNKCPSYSGSLEGYSDDISKELKKFIQTESMEANLKSYTNQFHLAGTHDNGVLADNLTAQLEQYNLKVKEATYRVLLSYQNWEKLNKVSLIAANGSVVYETEYNGRHPDAYHPQLNPYSAYAPNGTVQGELVYANYGEPADFAQLEENLVPCKDNIVIMRYGLIYRGDKIKNAEECGASGVLLYSDPADVTPMNAAPEDLYPKSWWMPGWGVQRGTVLRQLIGDPLTPGLPSIDGMYRLPEEDADLPTIPVHPIGYNEAENLMKYMKGPVGRQEFHGSLHSNVTYQLGPGYGSPRENFNIRLEVGNERINKNIKNVFGIIEGKEEPDRYVIVGCHYDAWTYGAVDPNSGTSVLMEVAKAFSNMTNKGWKPRRTIIFAHWDAQEQGLIGSYEWVEEHAQELSERTVAYINLDSAITGNYSMSLQATPLLHGLIHDTMRLVRAAEMTDNDSAQSLFSQWMKRAVDDDVPPPSIPYIDSGSDQSAFVNILGIPAFWPRYMYDKHNFKMTHFPAYHTMMDNFEYMKKFVDPNFLAHRSMAEMIAEATLRLASSAKLPMDAREYAQMLDQEYNILGAAMQSHAFNPLRDLNYLKAAIDKFNSTAYDFMEQFHQTDITNILETRRMNDRILQLSRAFIHPEGLPERPRYKNVLFAPNAVNHYQGVAFSGIREAIRDYDINSRSSNKQTQKDLLEVLRQQFSIATLAVQSASRILSDVTVT